MVSSLIASRRSRRLKAPTLVPLDSKKRFLEVSTKFYNKHKDALLPAYKVILKSLPVLSKAQIVKKGPFVISPLTTGSDKGLFNRIALRVDYGNETFFVKLGSHTASETSGAYSLTREYLSSIKNKLGDFNVGLVKYHLLYNPKESFQIKGGHRGVLVSDFVYSSNNIMLVDLAKQMGPEWSASPINQAYLTLRQELSSRGVFDVALKNVFYNLKTKTFQLFDLKTDGGTS